MATVIVNGQPIDIGSDRLNLVQAAARAGVHIPTYCWHPALSVVASCRMCLVEAGEKKPDGTVAMQPRVVPACQTPAKDGTVVITNSDKAREAQQQTLESLLLNHPLDCPVCDKAGECLLQDFSYRYGRSTSRMIDDKNLPRNKDYIGERITLFTDRCIMCSRCVRFTREISGTAELQVTSRGHHSEIDIFPGEPVNNKLAGNVVDLCPVGALCNKEFLYKQRVWFLKSRPSVCAGCSTGCSIHVDFNKDIVYRLRPRENPQAQGWFMCDEGRFDYAYVNDKNRLQQPLFQGQPMAWEKMAEGMRSGMAGAAKRRGSSLAAALSPMLTCEEAYLLAKLIKGFATDARLYLGWVPQVGQDDHYPQDRHGKPLPPIKFTIRAEKCPNRRGVEEIIKHFHGEVLGFDRLLAAVGAGEIEALYLTAGYSPRLGAWLDQNQLDMLKRLRLLVIQDLFPPASLARVKFALPASTFAEKDGCFVNQANLAQAIHWAVRPVAFGRTDGQIFLDLLQRRGLLHAESLRQELAREVPFFAPLGDGVMDERGVRLG